MTIFLTSDTFFGRELAAEERGFQSAEEMDGILIDNWNSVVKEDDVVFHLGNFGWDPISTEGSMIHLKGKIRFLQGVYDTHLIEMSLVRLGRHQVSFNSIMELSKEGLILSHWPLLDWRGRKEGIIHAHGGKIKTDVNDGYRFNVNIQNWNFRPIELDFIKEMIEIK